MDNVQITAILVMDLNLKTAHCVLLGILGIIHALLVKVVLVYKVQIFQEYVKKSAVMEF